MIDIDKYQIERGVMVDKTRLHLNPWNPNKTNLRQQTAIQESLNQYGQLTEIIVRPHPEIEGDYQIVDGEHRYQELPDRLYVNVIHNLSDNDAKKLTIVLNETKGQADKIELAQLLNELSDSCSLEELMIALPYESDELEEIIKIADFNWEEYNSNFEGEREGDNQSNPDSTTIHATIDKADIDTVMSVHDLIASEIDLDKNSNLAWGQVILYLCQKYL